MGFFYILTIIFSISLQAVSSDWSETCPPGSLDDLYLPALISVARKNTACLCEARNAFNRTYRRANFYIEGPFTGSIYEYKRLNVRISEHDATRLILSIFGDLIKYLHISFTHLNEADSNDVYGYVNDNCTKSLTELHLKDCHGIILNELKNPFPNVKIATFSRHPIQNTALNRDTLKLDEMFPNVNRLRVKVVHMDDWELVGSKFPYLKSLTLEFLVASENGLPKVDKLFKNSPNIDSLKILYCSLDMLKAASYFLPNLKNLYVEDASFKSYKDQSLIIFKNVSDLYLCASEEFRGVANRMVFNRLQSLQLVLDFDFSDDWIGFFMNQRDRSVEYLKICANSFTTQQLNTIASRQPFVKVADISSTKKLYSDGIVNFIEKSQMLNNLVIQAPMDITERTILEDKLPGDWDISYSNYWTGPVAMNIVRVNSGGLNISSGILVLLVYIASRIL